MSSLRDLPRRDLEALSAYLDGALPAAEAARLERRLASDAALRTALDDLRLTRRMLRSLPAVRPPRSFALSPVQAGIRRRASAFPALRLAAAVATFAFLAVSGLDLLMASPARLGAAAPAAEMPPQAEAFNLQAPAGEAALESVATVEESAAQAPSVLAGLAPTATAPLAERAVVQGTPAGLGGGPPPEAASDSEGEATPEAMLAAEPLATMLPSPSPTSTPMPSPAPLPTLTPAEPPAPRGFNLLHAIEIVLGGSAAGLILAALLLRRYS